MRVRIDQVKLQVQAWISGHRPEQVLDVTAAEEQDPEVGLLGPGPSPRLHDVEVDDVEGESHPAEVVRQDFLLASELREGRFQIHLQSKT